MPLLGINATPDDTARLAVSAPQVLFNHAGAGVLATLNKAAAGSDASLAFQSGFSTRALFGLLASDDLTLKVSPDGATWHEALAVARTTGVASVLAGFAIGGRTAYHRGNVVAAVAQSGGLPTGGILERGANANGEYLRLADGTQLCWKLVAGLGPVNAAMGSLFRSGTIALGSYAAAFAAPPIVGLQKTKATGLQDGWAGLNAPATTTSWGTATLFAAVSRADTDFELHGLAIGRWF